MEHPARRSGGSPSAISPSRSRLSLVSMLYSLGMVLVVTLAPFRFSAPEYKNIFIIGGWADLIANVLLFVPLGFLYPLTRGSRAGATPAHAFLLGLLVSGGIEAAQLFVADRFTSVADVITNAAGAGLGTVLQRAAARRIDVNPRLVGRLSLEMPLMGLVYLLVPLLWLASLGVQEQPLTLLPLVALGLFGGRLLAALQRHHFGPAGMLSGRHLGLMAGSWLVLGTFPALMRHPLYGAAMVAIIALLSVYESRSDPGEADRRFELHALRSAAPCLVVYFILTILVPLAAGSTGWRFELGLTGWSNGLSLDEQMRRLEPVGALTVLGYLLAEARGRLELPFRMSAPRLLLQGGLVAAALEAGHGFQLAGGASLVQLALLLAACLLGGGIYHLQRDHVRWILTASVPAPPPPGPATLQQASG